jgi:predicted RNA binding protein YcfA (HicA-like mRNA interferase family)
MLSREQEILWTLLKGDLLKDVDFSPPEMIRLLRRHKLLPLAPKILPLLPKKNADRWKQQLHHWGLKSEEMTIELIRIHQTIRVSAGVKPIYIKGPLLAEFLYGNVWDRQYSDLDILIRPDQVEAVVRVLKRDGYELKDPLSSHSQDEHFTYNNDLVLVHPGKTIMLELHIGLYVEQLLDRTNEKLFLNHLERTSFRGVELTILSAEYNFLYLCFHGTKHMYFRLSWLRDIARFMEEIEMNHSELVQIARALKWEKILYISLYQARKYFAVSLPPEFERFLFKNRYKILIKLCDRIIEGPGDLVYENYKELKERPNQIQGVNEVSFKNLIHQVSFLILLRNGVRARIKFLFYQLRKRA